jgi:hypothetical protein
MCKLKSLNYSKSQINLYGKKIILRNIIDVTILKNITMKDQRYVIFVRKKNKNKGMHVKEKEKKIIKLF